MPSLIEIGPVVLEREDEHVKLTDRQTEGRTSSRRTTGDQKSLLQLSAQMRK